MSQLNVKYREWEFEVDKALTVSTYLNVQDGAASLCPCNDCKNYEANRRNVFPEEIRQLFNDLGIDPDKEVEITSFEALSEGLCRVGGWFHFKGKIIAGNRCREILPTGGFAMNLTEVTDVFSIGFSEGNDLAFFSDKSGLIQVEFMTHIPWVIDKSV